MLVFTGQTTGGLSRPDGPTAPPGQRRVLSTGTRLPLQHENPFGSKALQLPCCQPTKRCFLVPLMIHLTDDSGSSAAPVARMKMFIEPTRSLDCQIDAGMSVLCNRPEMFPWPQSAAGAMKAAAPDSRGLKLLLPPSSSQFPWCHLSIWHAPHAFSS